MYTFLRSWLAGRMQYLEDTCCPCKSERWILMARNSPLLEYVDSRLVKDYIQETRSSTEELTPLQCSILFANPLEVPHPTMPNLRFFKISFSSARS